MVSKNMGIPGNSRLRLLLYVTNVGRAIYISMTKHSIMWSSVIRHFTPIHPPKTRDDCGGAFNYYEAQSCDQP